MRQPLARCLLLGLAIYTLTGSPLAAQETDPGSQAPTLLVSGSADLDIAPDRAVVRLGVEAQADDAAKAQSEVNRVANAILEAAKELGVEQRSIQTSNLTLYPVYSERRRPIEAEDGGPPEIVAYRGSNVVSITLDDLTKVGPTVDAAIQAGANAVQGISFELEDDEAARGQALAGAIADAQSKARAMAEALGMTLGAVIEVQEGGSSVQPAPYPRMMRMQSNAESSATPVSPGTVSVGGSVSVRYRLEP